MSPEKRTAFLVIHGVGEHTPFQACDSFVQGFCDVYRNTEKLKKKGTMIEAEHVMQQRQNWLGEGIPWIQNYVSLPVPEKETAIDFYEYYWDIYMVHQVHFAEAFKMLVNASRGARDFYKEHPDLLVKATDLGEFGRKRKFGTGEAEFKPAGYLKLLGPFFTLLALVLPYLPFVLNLLDKWAGTQIPIFRQLFGAFSAFMKEPTPNFIADLARYLDLDARSERFETRRKILNGALDELRTLLKDDRYDRVFVIGHSLGSVIAYDALNRIVQEINVERTAEEASAGWITRDEAMKIKALVTFGSPLDKIALFFRQRVKEGKDVQRQVLANLHGFRTVSLEKAAEESPEGSLEIAIDSPIKFKLDDTYWLNFYHTQDIISGRLDLYDLKDQPFKHLESKDGNISIKEDFGKARAHSCYWGEYQGKNKGTNEVYNTILKEFFE